jgi:DNA mismatch endonuclease, patch repair protein
MDTLTPEQRRLNMSLIRGKDTQPELVLRKALHAAGLRYRVHVPELPGRPDLVFARYRAAVFVHGCFWHCHEGCPVHKIPSTRRDFWTAKLRANVVRDLTNQSKLREQGWRVLIVWECAITGSRRQRTEALVSQCKRFLESDGGREEIQGKLPPKQCS